MQSRIFNPHTLPRQIFAIAMDIGCAWLALWLAICLRLDSWTPPWAEQALTYALAPALAIPIMVHFGLYRAIFRYTGFAAMLTTCKALAVYGVAFFAYVVLVGNPTHVPRSVGILQPLLFLLLIGGNRAFIRGLFIYGGTLQVREQGRVLIYGAGVTGMQTATALRHDRQHRLIGYVDEDPAKTGRSINGVEVWSAQDMPHVVRDSAVTDVLLAIPSLSRPRRNAIIHSLQGLGVHVRSVPNMLALASGTASVQQFQELDVEDLLGRDPVPPMPALIARHIAEQVVLVTGAGGSIGSELCRQIMQQTPQRLLLLDHSEYALYRIEQELRALAATLPQPPELVSLLGNVQDDARMHEIMRHYRPATIYHAAAYKHVPLVEHNPVQGLANNVFGTLTVARAAMQHGVAHCVLISTDKAVRPTNIMGASKRLAELCLQALAAERGTPVAFTAWDTAADAAQNTAPTTTGVANTTFSMVRFGNVLGSSGSVVPLFRQQIAAGGPITVTHAEVTRYFMTIPEAAQLVLQAGAMAQGGDVFVLDMGEPVRILHLAHQMVALAGRTVRDAQHPSGDIAIHITGLRPGEKLYEELLIGDNPQPTEHPRIMKAHENFLPWHQLQPHLLHLRHLMQQHDIHGIAQVLLQLVNGYSAGHVVDPMATAHPSPQKTQ